MTPALLDRLNASSEVLVSAGAAHFLQIALLAVLLLLIDLAFGRRIGPHWRCALWLIFFVKLVLPPQLSLPSSPVYWWSHHVQLPSPVMTPVEPAMSTMSMPADPWTADAAPAAVHDHKTDGNRMKEDRVSASAPSPASITTPSISWQAMAVAVWFVAFASLAIATVVRRRRVSRILQRGTPAPARLQAAMADACARIGVRAPVRLHLTVAGVGPLVTGVRRPIIYLPQSLAERLTPAQLHAVLVHELSHVKRGDLWVAAVQTLARLVFFYHPAVWWVNAHLARLREEATDRAVLAHPDVDARAYSLALVEAAAGAAESGSLSRFALGVIETKSQLRKRITMNLSQPRSGRVQLSRSGLFSLVLLGLVLIPMAPAQSAGGLGRTPAGFKALDAASVVKKVDVSSDSIFAAFNRRDRDAYVSAFTADAVMLAPGSPIITGQAGAGESYLRAPSGMRYEALQWADRQIYRIGRLIVDTGLVGFQFRLGPAAPVLTDPRQAFTIWEEGADGALRVKVLAWNPLPQPPNFGEPTEARAFDFAAADAPFTVTGDFSTVLQAEEAFHRAFDENRRADAANYYAEHAILFVPDTHPLRGHDAIRRYITSVPSDRSTQKIERQVAQVEGNKHHVLVVNLFRWTFTPANSEVPVSIAGKGVHLWERGADGVWRILFDLPNSSQPSAG